MDFTRNELERIFNTNFETLENTKEDDLEYIEQNHFGDLLIETYENNNERFKLWRNLDCNGPQIEIEYAGELNNHVWKTVFTQDLMPY